MFAASFLVSINNQTIEMKKIVFKLAEFPSKPRFLYFPNREHRKNGTILASPLSAYKWKEFIFITSVPYYNRMTLRVFMMSITHVQCGKQITIWFYLIQKKKTKKNKILAFFYFFVFYYKKHVFLDKKTTCFLCCHNTK